MSVAREGTCRGCGALILWIRRADNGRWHPVERAPKTGYTMYEDRPGWDLCTIHESHFAHCARAADFRGGGEAA